MGIFRKLQNAWRALRWKMLFIFAFFSLISMFLVACFSLAILNVVIRRESVYFVQQDMNRIAEACRRLTPVVLDRVQGCQSTSAAANAATLDPGALWPQVETSVSVLPDESFRKSKPKWLKGDSFSGIVVNDGALEIRSFRVSERKNCSVVALLRVPVSESLERRMSAGADLVISDSKPQMLRRYPQNEEIRTAIEANFIPGSKQPVSVVVTARNWQTGMLEDWAVYRVRPSYARTLRDLSQLGSRRASWVSLLGAIALALVLVYAAGLLLSIRLSQRIVNVVDSLSDAALRVGKGDFSVRVEVPQHDQLGDLASSFNDMTHDLADLRSQEKQRVVLERDMTLAHEVQQYLYPRIPPVVPGAQVCGMTTPARTVSGDLYDFLSFSESEIGLLCADISGKGVSAALMMAHLQALTRGRLLRSEGTGSRPDPAKFVTALNRDFQGRFGNNRYATMLYGEFDAQSRIFRYTNAGHPPPVLITASGGVTLLGDGDLPVGLFPQVEFKELRVCLPENSALLIYTDGVTDALNADGEQFGEERLKTYCANLPKGSTAETICTLLSRRLLEWAAGVDRFDDTTILVLSVGSL